MEKIEKLIPFLPPEFIDFVKNELGDKENLEIRIAKPRFSKWGDFRKVNAHYVISINSNLNPYQFLLTLLHEYAHYLAHMKFGSSIKPHGQEWKNTFRNILLDLVRSGKLPYELKESINHYAKNPRAAVTTDLNLKRALEKFSYKTNIKPIILQDLEPGSKFIFNGRLFERLEQRRKLIKCRDLKKDKMYLFQPDTIVKKI